MLFNSLVFFIFLPIVFTIYWGFGRWKLKIQNLFLLVASYVFYGWWDYRFLSLIMLSTLVDYLIGQGMESATRKFRRKAYLWISILFNLGMLGFFKYYNFFVESLSVSLQLLGFQESSLWTLNILLPVGISFYTFQTLSYSLDIYKGKLKPTRDFIAFATFVSFFPQLVAGPIERASNLLPQINTKRTFSYAQAADGLKLILWGLFKKVAIADSLAVIVDDVFLNYADYSGSTLALGLIFFSFQIYGDFSGYSDISIGTAKLFGIELMSNFRFPYFSRNISEFWHRWHVSLSTWFRDYLYIPLGGSREGRVKAVRNIFIIFLVSGFWHGANWTFLIWGGIHASLYLPVFLMGKNRSYVGEHLGHGSLITNFLDFLKLLQTFILVTLSWTYFRAENLASANGYLGRLFGNLGIEEYHHPRGYRMIDYFILLGIFVLYEYLIRHNERKPVPFRNKVLRLWIYTLLVLGLLLFYDSGSDRSFIYFQF
ncbi:D-alanyl-lipoteichoic acid acyltransferase DltB, MBOAT superfamily [Muriicola jejuensis]|uniref:MBOAT family protein n=1 Tax=Muriicola jejuensis TaxID=504488 RepID=A0A6P0UI64_9FLAO|nr:MBOAT family protein [Muriicola jejuensis]NER11548.1 MBOAT family protein [Muriicola jejuensis]SMP19746.1 D-alanyl-lipoteichoic acid acyltransferase DltB, MBOAT superfamily [Muriicola jejuensis]